jgi:hypothetical protein
MRRGMRWGKVGQKALRACLVAVEWSRTLLANEAINMRTHCCNQPITTHVSSHALHITH